MKLLGSDRRSAEARENVGEAIGKAREHPKVLPPFE